MGKTATRRARNPDGGYSYHDEVKAAAAAADSVEGDLNHDDSEDDRPAVEWYTKPARRGPYKKKPQQVVEARRASRREKDRIWRQKWRAKKEGLNQSQAAYRLSQAVKYRLMQVNMQGRIDAKEAVGKKGVVAKAMREFDGYTYRTAFEKQTLEVIRLR